MTAARVKLKPAQIMMAASVGIMRHVHAIQSGLKHRYGASSDNGWQRDIDGALGEYAVAIYANRCWQDFVHNGDPAIADVGGILDVRTITKNDRKLIVHPGDSDDRPYVLAFCELPHVDLLGWLFARDGKQQEFWRDPKGGRAAFFVPQSELRPMPELLLWLESKPNEGPPD